MEPLTGEAESRVFKGALYLPGVVPDVFVCSHFYIYLHFYFDDDDYSCSITFVQAGVKACSVERCDSYFTFLFQAFKILHIPYLVVIFLTAL